MTGREDRNWELLNAVLSAESSGKSPRMFASRRTLFGIPSALDQEMAKLAESDGVLSVGSHDSERDPEGKRSAPSRHEMGSRQSKNPSKSSAARVVHPLRPVFDEHSRVLILGTMPSPKSRETGFYYNHPQNRFWKVMAALFDEPIPETNEAKKALVLSHGIALWDVLAECTIEGAADGTISECIPNNISSVLAEAPIEAIFCTGAKATEFYQKFCQPRTGRPCIRLASTSPANAAKSLNQLIEEYSQILPYCEASL